MTEFESIYRKHFRDVFLYIMHMSGSEQVAEEITSETFYKALQSIDGFRGDCDIRVWLCQIAKNCYYTYLRKHKKESIENVNRISLSTGAETVEEQLLRKTEAVQIQMILHDIPEPYKEVFMWRVFVELSYKQIGGIFDKSDNWACVTYHRARKMIQSRLEEISNEK